MDVGDYNIAFTQCLSDLGDQIQGEQVKIEKYRLGLQSDMREMVRNLPRELARRLCRLLLSIVRSSGLLWLPGLRSGPRTLLPRRSEASAWPVEVEVVPALSLGWEQLANSLRSRRLTTSRRGSAISVERQVILLRIALIGILEGHLTRTRSRRRARKTLSVFRISRQCRSTS
jgi:hypothetical protein